MDIEENWRIVWGDRRGAVGVLLGSLRLDVAQAEADRLNEENGNSYFSYWVEQSNDSDVR